MSLPRRNASISFRMENEFDGHSKPAKDVLFFKKHQKIVSSSFDNTIRVWNTSGQCKKIIRGVSVSNMIKWDDDTFVLCSFDSKLRIVDVADIEKSFNENLISVDCDSIVKLHKICNEQLMIVSLNHEKMTNMYLIEYSNGRTISKYEPRNVPIDRIFITNSRKWKDYIYVNCSLEKTRFKDSRNEVVEMLNFRKNEVVQTFLLHDTNLPIHSIVPFMNYVNEEQLIIVLDQKICVYNTAVAAGHNLLFEFSIIGASPFTSSFMFKQWIFVGDQDGSIYQIFLHLYLSMKTFVKNPLTDQVSIVKNQFRQVSLRNEDTKLGSIFSRGTGIKNFNSMISIQRNRYNKYLVTSTNSNSFRIVILSLLEESERKKCARFVNHKIGKYIKTELGPRFTDDNERKENFQNLKKIVHDFIKNILYDYLQLETRFLKDFFESVVLENTSFCFEQFPNIFFFDDISSNKNEHYLYVGEVSMDREKTPNGYGILFQKLKKSKSLFRKKNTLQYCPCYIGEFRDGMKWGVGLVFSFASFSRFRKHLSFSGEFVRNLRDGRGMEFRILKKNHNLLKTFEGRYDKGKRHGRGEFMDLDEKKVVKGIWNHGVLDETSVFSFKCPIIDYYEISEHLISSKLLASGANGNVYKVETSVLPESLGIKDEFVAIKLMKCSSVYERKIMFRMIKRGIELCCKVQQVSEKNVHKNHVCVIFGIFTGPKEIGYIMELCKFSVNHVITTSHGTLGLGEKKRIIFETALGMKSLHDFKVMHRDLKWPNIMIGYDDTCKITDFDTLKEDERNWRLESLPATSRIGTTGCLAPEVFLGKRHRLESDVYSFGVMIYCLLFEINQPFATQKECNCGTVVENIFLSNSLEFHVANCNLRPNIFPKKASKFPKYLVDLMECCWDKDPLRRPTFNQIVHVFRNEDKKNKCYTILQLRFPKHEDIKNQSMLLVEPKIDKIKEWVEKKFPGSKVIRISHSIFGSIEKDMDVFKLINKLEDHILDVELDQIDMSQISHEDDNNYGDYANLTSSKKVITEMKMMRERLLEMENEKKEMLEKHKLEVLNLTSSIEKHLKKNERLENRILVLESLLSKNRIKLPPKKKEQEETEGEEGEK